MAVTKTHPIKSTLKAAIDYICNSEKTDGKLLVSSYGCAAETADTVSYTHLDVYKRQGCLFWPPNRESSCLSLAWLEKGVQKQVVQIWGYRLCVSERFSVIHDA